MHLSPIINLINFLNGMLRPLGSSDYQEQEWIAKKNQSNFDYDEDTMDFLYQCEEILKNPKRHEGVNDFVHQKLKKFYEDLCLFDDKIASNLPEDDDETIINSPEWQKVRALANETYDAIMKDLKERNYELE